MNIKKLFTALFAIIIGISSVSVSAAAVSYISGDVNSDGVFNVADVVELQKWLLNDGTNLVNWKAGDFCQDGILDVFDLCLMKRELILNNTKGRTVQVDTTEKLRDALKNAEAGDTILLAGGEYEWEQKGIAGSLFYVVGRRHGERSGYNKKYR